MPKDYQDAPLGHPIFDDGELIHVKKACAEKDMGWWSCISHRCLFPDVLAMEMHAATLAPPHLVAWYCAQHGLETPA